METKELAKQLGISHQMTNRYKAKGMPVNSLEAAIAWRNRNVDPFRSKTGRIGGNSGVKRGAAQKKVTPTDTSIKNSITETLTHIVPNQISQGFLETNRRHTLRGGLYNALFVFETKLLGLPVLDGVRDQIRHLFTEFCDDLEAKKFFE